MVEIAQKLLVYKEKISVEGWNKKILGRDNSEIDPVCVYTEDYEVE